MAPKQNPPFAALLLVASLCVLSLLDSSGKWLQQGGVGLAVVLWFRYVGQALLVLFVCTMRRRQMRWQVKSIRLQLLRGLLMLASSALFFKSLSILPIAEATAVNFTAPIFTLVLAPWLLGEARLPYRWPLALTCLCGALLVTRPGAGFETFGVVLALLTALAFSLYQMVTRMTAADSPLMANLYTGWFGTVAVSLFILLTGDFKQLIVVSGQFTHLQWLVLISLGVIGSAGHVLQVTAYRYAPTNTLVPFMYLQIVPALAMGWLFFNQWPDWISLVGMSIVCAAGLTALVLLRERQPAA
jgi:drug/metabolite transporter (DMT)-like permease